MEERSQLLLPFFVLVALAAASRVDAFRAYEAIALALGVPVFVVLSALGPLRDARTTVRSAAIAVALLVLIGTELAIGGAVFGRWQLKLGSVLVALGGCAVVIEAVAARYGLRSRYAAWMGIAVALGTYLPSHFDAANGFGAVLAALLVAVFTGGGAGLLLGAGLTALLRRG
jgi:uncharacterized membrane protein